jgi:hypothetical protein
MRRSTIFVVMLLVIAACNTPDTSAPGPTPAPPVQSAGSSTPVQSPGTLSPTLPAAAATALPPSLAGATALPEESPWANANAAELARTLAARIADAQSDPARQTALLQVMRALNIGVYTADGVAVLRGAERGPHDFYLYDFELGMMAASLGRHDAWSIADVTAALNEMGFRSDDKPLADEQFTSVLLAAAREADQTPADRLSLPLLLVRELGLRQPTAYDLLKEPKQDAVTFSALQKFLITIDIELPIVREAKIASGPSRLAAESNGVLQLKPVSQSSVCDSMVATVAKEGWGAGKLFITLTGVANIPVGTVGTAGAAGAAGATLNAAALAIVIVDSIHGAMLAYSVKVQELPEPRATHYGHEAPGEEFRFRVSVAMLDQLEEIVIKCGWLLGVEFPKKGGIPGVKMLWLNGGLDEHGTVICEANCKQTGPDGIATLVFQPKHELPFYGYGPQKTRVGMVMVLALYQSRHKNYLGSVAQLISPKGVGGMLWSVSYHDQPEFDLDFGSILEGTDGGFRGRTVTSAKVHLTYDPAKGFVGEGALTYETTPLPRVRSCDLTWSGSGSTTFEVVYGHITGDPSRGETPQVELYIVTGPTHETATTLCPLGQPPLTVEGSFWTALWNSGRLKDFDFGVGGFPVKGWKWARSAPGEIFAQNDWQSRCEGHCTEQTLFTLVMTSPK